MRLLKHFRLFLFYLLGISILYFGVGGFIYLELVQAKTKIELSPQIDETVHNVGGIHIKGKEKAVIVGYSGQY
jgi:hypothetical protein